MRHKTMDIAVMMSFLVSILLLIGCASEVQTDVQAPTKLVPSEQDLENREYCTEDTDCICGGIDPATGGCFIGSRSYYENYVDKDSTCPDFCTGIAGNLAIKCVDNKCIQMYECIMDSECEEGESCVSNRCVSSGQGSSDQGNTECKSDSDCRKGGCSGQLCEPKSLPPRATNCEFLPEYECFKHTECGCTDGKCAWAESSEYDACVKQARGQ